MTKAAAKTKTEEPSTSWMDDVATFVTECADTVVEHAEQAWSYVPSVDVTITKGEGWND